jgi:hypothetical protein
MGTRTQDEAMPVAIDASCDAGSTPAPAKCAASTDRTPALTTS